MFINELEWRSLSEAERLQLQLLLAEARERLVNQKDDVRWWTYRARIIELLLDNPAERGEDIHVCDLVVYLAKALSTADIASFGPEHRIAGKRKMEAFRGLPGIAAEALVLFQSNVATSPRFSPFDGRCVAP
ncbi:hypothetical protein QSV36_10145 [Pseudomonas sp. BCRC 81390]|uniref:hypothetical protein n=1 Tax=Pseudomonas sp. BCRC 81390 TaxID=3054778 RepID=UPI002593C6EE|nr:hypothetical protein [Pseudomonas sp. BCRC 81390]MDM3885957.1 hypothetical protein [Pseudomonas sp. BCRC 81390]